MTLFTDNPYRDDYCYLATKFKASSSDNKAKMAKMNFAPTDVRELLPTEKGSNRDPVEFLKIEGLGVYARSNLKGPKPLLDVGMGESAAKDNTDLAEDHDHDDDDGERKALSEEPMLAARCLIEDGECLLLDIDDVDRIIFSRNGNGQLETDGKDGLSQRRVMLIDALAASLHITNAGGESVKKSVRDGVFLRVTMLAKGILVFARFLKRLKPGQGSDAVILGIVLTTLRNVSHLFSRQDDRKSEAVSHLSGAIAKVLRSLDMHAIEELAETDGDFSDMLAAEEELPLFVYRKGKYKSTGLSDILLVLFDVLEDCDSTIGQSFKDSITSSVNVTLTQMKVEASNGNLDTNAMIVFEKLQTATTTIYIYI